MTSRSRCVPASGAMVKPDLRTRRICSASSGVIVEACIDDNEMDTFSGAKRSIRSNITGWIEPYSPVLSEDNENWS